MALQDNHTASRGRSTWSLVVLVANLLLALCCFGWSVGLFNDGLVGTAVIVSGVGLVALSYPWLRTVSTHSHG